MHIVSIVGARPNFVKIAPVARAIQKDPSIRHTIIHTGQHYDDAMSASFFEALGIPAADYNLGVGSSSHGVQTGQIMIGLEPLFQELRPDWVLTVGDVNSTAAAAMVSVKLGIKTTHVEAGLRSFDRTMPEEINRLVTDSISDLLFVSEPSGVENLKREGVDDSKMRFVGNVMIDSLVYALPRIETREAWKSFDLKPNDYLLATFHRPGNVDEKESLTELVEALIAIAKKKPVLFPIHPRTKAKLEEFGMYDSFSKADGIHMTDPLDYITFLSLLSKSYALLTDSGGIQEETTFLKIPCFTLRPNTERPVTITQGTNRLVATSKDALLKEFADLEQGNWNTGNIPELWDGHTAERIVKEIKLYSPA